MVQQRILPPAEPLSDDPASIHRKTAMRPLPSQRMRVTGTLYGVAPGAGRLVPFRYRRARPHQLTPKHPSGRGLKPTDIKSRLQAAVIRRGFVADRQLCSTIKAGQISIDQRSGFRRCRDSNNGRAVLLRFRSRRRIRHRWQHRLRRRERCLWLRHRRRRLLQRQSRHLFLSMCKLSDTVLRIR